jgi:hypothetical protein
MRIQIKLMDIFRDYVPPGSDASKFMLGCRRNDSIDDIFFKLRIPAELPRVIVHNGQIADKDRLLTDGDVVAVFSPIFGG